jgi:hypothetical protein
MIDAVITKATAHAKRNLEQTKSFQMGLVVLVTFISGQKTPEIKNWKV